jgi:Fe-S-cluster containining protein
MTHKLALLPESAWYSEGLNFSCTECGQCCTGSPGHVWLTRSEAEQLAIALDLPLRDFLQRYTRQVGARISLLEDPRSHDCVFLKDGRCSVYQARPEQCRTFPWWPHNLESEEAWRRAAGHCEGIHPDAAQVSQAEIEQQSQKQSEAEAAYTW